jgi:hypothetical protein
MKASILAVVALAIAAVAITPSIRDVSDQHKVRHSEAALRAKPLGKLMIDTSEVIVEPACNATSFAQLPDDASLFIGRRLVNSTGELSGVSGPNNCSGGDPANQSKGLPFNRWGLVLDRFDWQTYRFVGATALLDTSPDPTTGRSRAVITGGPMRHLRIRSAYDPSVVRFGNATFVAFECTFDNGDEFGLDQTSSCISVYDPTARKLDMSRTLVAVRGERQGSLFKVAAVPRLLAFERRLYLYWSALTIEGGIINGATVRGAELIEQQDGSVRVKGSDGAIRPADSLSTEVWQPSEDKMSNRIVNLMGFSDEGRSFVAFAALGGEGCSDPLGQGPGCFRLVAKRSFMPLGRNAIAQGETMDLRLPSNPQEYAAPIVDPLGNPWLIGHFIRPIRNGFADRNPAPSMSFWRTSERQSVLLLSPLNGR